MGHDTVAKTHLRCMVPMFSMFPCFNVPLFPCFLVSLFPCFLVSLFPCFIVSLSLCLFVFRVSLLFGFHCFSGRRPSKLPSPARWARPTIEALPLKQNSATQKGVSEGHSIHHLRVGLRINQRAYGQVCLRSNLINLVTPKYHFNHRSIAIV